MLRAALIIQASDTNHRISVPLSVPMTHRRVTRLFHVHPSHTDTSTLPPRYGAYVLEVAVTAPRPSDIPGLESDAADVTTASFYFGLVNAPPTKPVILGINTAGDSTNGDRIVEVDGCGGALALFAAKGEGNLLEPPTDPEQAG